MSRNIEDDESALIFGEGGMDGMQQFETYESFHLNLQNPKLKKQAEKIIESICDTYLSLPTFSEDVEEPKELQNIRKYIQQIKKVEISNLMIMAKQVKVAEHILDTLMRRLDSGGYVDNELYSNIREQRKDLMEVTLLFSKYVRSLPDYFAIVRSEIGAETINLNSVIEQQKSLNNHNDVEVIENVDDEYVALPMRGTKEMALNVQNSIARLKQRAEESKNIDLPFDPKDITNEEE